ncbi:MAG: beta-lactamase family protein [Olivibacter sp.]|nr:beta-lactamase family protein [Olivibacter sp. UJ_SKK_5.1]
MKILLTYLILLLTSASYSYAQLKAIHRIDSLFTELTEKNEFSGAVLIADSTTTLLQKGYGYADRENKIKNTADTRFDLSSASKVFTGTAITYLAQQGRLNFNDTIGTYIKGLPKGDVITIHQILTHSAGFDDFYKAKGFSYRNIKNCTDMLPFMKSMPLVYSPGDSCIYSTGDLIVLGALIEKITGMDFQDYIQISIIKPLKLKNTSFTPYWTLDETQRQYAIGYSKDSTHIKRKPYDYDNGSIPLSAGGAWSSISDLYKFDRAVFTGKILNEKYLKLMTTPYTPQWDNAHFGYVWIITDKGAFTSIGHPGNSSGWQAMNEYYPDQGYTVIILSNLGSVDIFQLTQQVEKILFHN